MATDACIVFRTVDGQPIDLSLPQGATLELADPDFWIEGATHTVWQSWRFHGPGYTEGGDWPRIVSVLLALFAHPAIETVWYYGDHEDDPLPYTATDLLEDCAAYLGVDVPLWNLGPACRVCGCTDDHACPGGCFWVEEDLCSRCAIPTWEVPGP